MNGRTNVCRCIGIVKYIDQRAKYVVCFNGCFRRHTVGEKGVDDKTDNVADKHHTSHFPEACAVKMNKREKHRRNEYKPQEIGNNKIFAEGNAAVNGGVDYVFRLNLPFQSNKA